MYMIYEVIILLRSVFVEGALDYALILQVGGLLVDFRIEYVCHTLLSNKLITRNIFKYIPNDSECLQEFFIIRVPGEMG